MPDIFSPRQKERLYIFTLVCVGLLRFLNLGFLDLQAWDEALYAVRAEGILRFGGFLDQTPFSVSGLYSALHPPLYVWLTSGSFLVFGVTEFAARFCSAVFGALTLAVIYQLGKDLRGPRLGFYAAMLFGLNPFVTFYSRQGQFDTTLVFFLSLAVLFYARMRSKSQLRYAILSGLAVGAALMTKLFVGLGVPLSLFLWKASTQQEEREFWRPFVISLAVAAIVAAPWFVYMTIVRGHGNPMFFLDASAILDRSVTGVEGNVKPLEIFYFVNQLLVLFPLGVIAFGYGFFSVLKERDRSWLIQAAWFAIFFIVFSLMRTKLAVYLLPMLVPASLLGARVISDLSSGMFSRRISLALIGATALSFLWASNQAWRNATKSILSSALHAQLPGGAESLAFLPFLALLAGTILLTRLFSTPDRLERLRPILPASIFVCSFLFCFYDVIGYDQYQYKDGASELADVVLDRQPSTIVAVGFDRNPQLSFYLAGADIGWRDDIVFSRLTPPADRAHFRGWLSEKAGTLPSDALLIVEKDKLIRYEWFTTEEVNPVDYSLVFESRRYAAFQRVPSSQLAAFNPRSHP